jgi:hypothetical protein
LSTQTKNNCGIIWGRSSIVRMKFLSLEAILAFVAGMLVISVFNLAGQTEPSAWQIINVKRVTMVKDFDPNDSDSHTSWPTYKIVYVVEGRYRSTTISLEGLPADPIGTGQSWQLEGTNNLLPVVAGQSVEVDGWYIWVPYSEGTYVGPSMVTVDNPEEKYW